MFKVNVDGSIETDSVENALAVAARMVSDVEILDGSKWKNSISGEVITVHSTTSSTVRWKVNYKGTQQFNCFDRRSFLLHWKILVDETSVEPPDPVRLHRYLLGLPKSLSQELDIFKRSRLEGMKAAYQSIAELHEKARNGDERDGIGMCVKNITDLIEKTEREIESVRVDARKDG